MRNEVQDGHPCESCLRWPECNGVDWPTCQAENTDALATIPDGTDLNEIKAPGVYRTNTADGSISWGLITSAPAAAFCLYREAYNVLDWATKNRPRLLHLAGWAKKRKDRRKNLRRIIREYIKGD
jgi:hypothetical protein